MLNHVISWSRPIVHLVLIYFIHICSSLDNLVSFGSSLNNLQQLGTICRNIDFSKPYFDHYSILKAMAPKKSSTMADIKVMMQGMYEKQAILYNHLNKFLNHSSREQQFNCNEMEKGSCTHTCRHTHPHKHQCMGWSTSDEDNENIERVPKTFILCNIVDSLIQNFGFADLFDLGPVA